MKVSSYFAVTALIGLLALCGCADAAIAPGRHLVAASAMIGARLPAARQVRLRFVLPSAANPKVDPAFDAPNVVAPSVVAPRAKLFVFLPGAYGTPSHYELILEQAAAHGYPAIGLEYPNGQIVDRLCKYSADVHCWDGVREEILTGENASPLLSVTPVDSIERRLADVLAYLQRRYPSEGWGAYLAGSRPKWSRIVVGGHSEGGGNTAYIAKRRSVARACFIEDPADGNDRTPVAAWLSAPGRTPASLQYGFSNKLDKFSAFARIAPEWAAIGIPGALTSVDTSGPPYGNSHRLYTATYRERILASHGVTVADEYTPIGADGMPLFAPVWNYLCGFASTTGRRSAEALSPAFVKT